MAVLWPRRKAWRGEEQGAPGLCAGGARPVSAGAGHCQAAGQLLGALWFGNAGPLGAELPNLLENISCPHQRCERQNSLERAVTGPSQQAFHSGQILSHHGCDSGLPKPTASLLLV